MKYRREVAKLYSESRISGPIKFRLCYQGTGGLGTGLIRKKLHNGIKIYDLKLMSSNSLPREIQVKACESTIPLLMRIYLPLALHFTSQNINTTLRRRMSLC